MFRRVKELKSGRLLLVLLALFVLLTSLAPAVVAADNAGKRIELNQSDIASHSDVGPEAPGPEGGEKPTNSRLKRSDGDSTQDHNNSAVDSNENPSEAGAKSDPETSQSDEMPMPAPSLLKQATPVQDNGSAASPGGHAPFNLGVRQTVMDGGIDDEGTTLQGGAGATVDNQFPPLGGGTNKTEPLKGGTSGTTLKGGLTQAQLQKLANHDLVLIIDQSGSMHTPDCPISGAGRIGGTVMSMLLGSVACVSRWQWCKEQTLHLAEQTRYVSAKGLSVVLFSSNFRVFPHVTLDQIPTIFREAAPEGGTNLTDPLRTTINDYFARRQITRGNVKPLGIAIITDGRPNSEADVRQVIIQATQYMRDPQEISITIFLIGNSAFNGQSFVEDLERNLTRRGAKYSIVHGVSFWNLMKVGLPRALADAL